MSDKERGMYQKYIVTELDENGDVKPNQYDGMYVVLKMGKDPYAIAALKAYARACAAEYPKLAEDFNKLVAESLSVQTNARIEQFKSESTN